AATATRRAASAIGLRVRIRLLIPSSYGRTGRGRSCLTLLPNGVPAATCENPHVGRERPVFSDSLQGGESARIGHHGVMSLFWRAFSINAAVIVVGAIVLSATPGHIDFPGSVSDAIAALVVLALVLGANLVLLRPLFEPLRRMPVPDRTL